MSDAAKPEEKPVVLEPPKVAEEVPTTSEAAPAAGVDDVTPVVTDAPAGDSAAAEEKKEKPEPKEITQGTLHKAHGGLLAFFKQKRFFYFQDEPISEDKLKVYLHKVGASRSAAAYASQTGKGLLLYAKTEGQKEVPHGIIKLADVTDVVPVGATKFILKLATQELQFESLVAERDSWVFTLNHKISEAKAASEEIINSEGYKAAFEKLTKPTVIAAAKAPEKTEEGKEADTEAAKDTEPNPEGDDVVSAPSGAEEEAGPADKKTDFKRSPSKNKRTSVFAFFDKKKKPEEKKEDIVENKEEGQKGEVMPAEQETVAPAVVAEASTDVPTEAKEATEAGDTEKPVESAAPKPVKRNSIFSPFNREKKEAEEEKKHEIKAETAEPTKAATEAKPIDVPTEAVEKTPVSASSPPKPKFFPSFFDKKEKSPVAKAAEKETEPKPAEITETPVETTEITPVIAVDDPAAPDAVSPATSPKEQKRKSSFFSFNKKDKKSEDVKSDSEDAEPAHKSGPTSPLPKTGAGILGLMRKASKSTKHTGKEAENKEVASPETVAEEPTATTEAGETATVSVEPTEPAATSIGDVVPEAVTVGQSPLQATT